MRNILIAMFLLFSMIFAVGCEQFCDRFPNHEKCQVDAGDGDDGGVGPMCVELDQPCVDEEEPGYLPCCGEAEGLTTCNLGQCREVDNTPCTPINAECDPNGLPCCRPSPAEQPGVCELSDPEDPNAVHVCAPAP